MTHRSRPALVPALQHLEPRRLLAAGQDDSYAATHSYGSDAKPAAVAVQKDGKVLVASSVLDGLGTPFVTIARFLPGGGLDATFNDVASPTAFNGDGKRSFYFGHFSDSRPTDLAVDAFGRIVVVGTNVSGSFGTNVGVARLLPSGAFDSSFDGDGVRTVDIGDNTRATSVAIEASSRVVVGGYRDTAEDDALLLRLTEGGALDSAFSADGWLTFAWNTSFGESNADAVTDLYLDAFGRATFAGIGSTGLLGLGRATIGGNLDVSFDGDGLRTWGPGSIVGSATLANQAGRIVVAYATPLSATTDFAVRRFSNDGALDGSFNGGTGLFAYKHYLEGGGTGAAVSRLLVQRDGKLLITGSNNQTSAASPTLRATIARLHRDGGFDASWDGDGKRTLSSTATVGGIPVTFAVNGRATDVALDGDGKAYVVAAPSATSNSIRVYRLQGGQYGYKPNAGAWALGDTVQAEDFDFGGQNESYYDSAPFYDIGYRGGYQDIVNDLAGTRALALGPGEWSEYTFAVPAGTYQLELLARSDVSSTVAVSVSGGATLATLNAVPGTGYTTATGTLALSGANPTLRLTASGSTAYLDLLRLKAVTTGAVSGVLWRDDDGDGVFNALLESRLVGRTVYLDANNNVQLDPGEATTTTNASGTYTFPSLAPGTYKVRQVLPPGWQQTRPSNGFGHNPVVTVGTTAGPFNFGSRPVGTASVSGEVWQVDANGASVACVGGRTVYLDLNNNVALDPGEPTTLTNPTTGGYAFNGLVAGTYKVRQVLPSGWVQVTPANGFGHNATLADGQSVGGLRFNSRPPAARPAMSAMPVRTSERAGLFSELELDRK